MMCLFSFAGHRPSRAAEVDRQLARAFPAKRLSFSWRASGAAFIAAMLTSTAGSPAPQQAPVPASVPSSRLAAYDELLEELSDKPVAERWANVKQPEIVSNIMQLYRTYPGVEGKGGIMVAGAFLQNLNLIPHARPEKAYLVDINPLVNELMLPLLGRVAEEAPSRREFLSMLWSMPVTEDDVHRLLDARTVSQDRDEKVPEGELMAHITRVMKELQERITLKERLENAERLAGIASADILPRLPIEPGDEQHIDGWIQTFLQELLSENFYFDQARTNALASSEAERRQWAGWLATEENYQMVRSYWMGGRLIGLTGDLAGPGASKITARIGGSQRVTVVYVSCIPTDVEEDRRNVKASEDLFHVLSRLPLDPQAVVVGGYHSPLDKDKSGNLLPDMAYAMPFRLDLWSYDYLRPADSFARTLIVEKSLMAADREGQEAIWIELLVGVQLVLVNRDEADDKQTIENYRQVLGAARQSPQVLMGMGPDQFAVWARKTAPKLDTTTDIFRAVVVTLVERGILEPPASLRQTASNQAFSRLPWGIAALAAVPFLPDRRWYTLYGPHAFAPSFDLLKPELDAR
jgi:hypothetical protein